MSTINIRILLFLIFTSFLFAQTGNYSNTSYKWDDWDDWKFEFDYDRPFIELNYGLGKQNHEKLNGDLPDVGLMELKLGYLKERTYVYDFLDDRKESFVFVSKLDPDLTSSNDGVNLSSTLWRFGFATRNTLGYYGENISVLPYHQDGFAWSRLELPEDEFPSGLTQQQLNLLPIEAEENYKIIERYRDAFRFGSLVEGGVRIEFADFISVNAGYEAAVIFPRHLFWKHAGSFIIEKAGEGALSFFINEITEASPEAGPVVRFLLLNAYSYAFHLLKQEDMNWPFATETPLTYETFKFGLTFTF